MMQTIPTSASADGLRAVCHSVSTPSEEVFGQYFTTGNQMLHHMEVVSEGTALSPP